MSVTAAMLSGESDLQELLAFLAAERARNGPCGLLHMGDVIWRFFTPTPELAVDLSQCVRLWWRDGAIIGASFCWLPDDSAEIMISQTDYDPGVEREAFAFAVDSFRRAGRPRLMVGCCARRAQRASTLAALGFTKGPDELDMLHTMVEPGGNLAPPPSAGYRLCDARNLPVPLEAFLAGRPHDAVRYRAMTARPEYRADLDLAMFQGEERAGFAIGWLDPRNRTGLLEPVGVSEAHRRRGIGLALVTEALRRLFELGAERAFVFPMPANVPSMRLYTKAGFRPLVLDETWSFDLST